MIVVDASIVVTALVDALDDGDRCRDRLRHEELAAPELLDLEVVSVLRRLVRADHLEPARASQAIEDLQSLRVERAPHAPMVARCWALRDNLTPYDAAYVALAELTGSVLITGDARLARSPGPRCRIEVLASRP